MVRKASQKAWSQIARVKEKEMKPIIMDAIEIEGMEAMVLSHRHLRQGVGRPGLHGGCCMEGPPSVNKCFGSLRICRQGLWQLVRLVGRREPRHRLPAGIIERDDVWLCGCELSLGNVWRINDIP